MTVSADADLIGRDAELVRIREFLASAMQGPSAMLVRGEPGLGKTTLWRAAIESAESRGLTVLSARCVEAELPFGLVGLSDLLQAAFPRVAEELTPHERAALAVAIGLEPPEDAPRDPIALPRAFLALIRALARKAPVLIAVDDVQWLDAPSARVVSFAARRFGDLRVGILATQRGDSQDPLNLAGAFGEKVDELRLGPLTLGALAHLVRTRLGVRIARPALARVHEASGGNPMFALEFARSLAESTQPQLGPLAIPESLHELIRARVARYPRGMRRLLAIFAAYERPTRSLRERSNAEAAGLPEAAGVGGALPIA